MSDTHSGGWRNRGGGSDWGGLFLGTVGGMRTEVQVRPAEGFAPELVTPRHEQHLVSEGGPTLRLAVPPAWTEAEGMPCVPMTPLQTKEEMQAWHDRWDLRGDKEAARACEGCPVLDECRAAAIEEERGLSRAHRFLVRGGLTPGGRWALEQGLTTPDGIARTDQSV